MSSGKDPIDLERRAERFRIIYDTLHDDLWRYCRRRSPDDSTADDVLAEVLTVAWEQLDDVPIGPDARPWLFAVARNRLRSGWRRRRRAEALTNRLIGELLVRPSAVQPLDPVVGENEMAVLRALHSLRSGDQEIIRLAAWEQLSHGEIGIVLGCSENAVAIRLHRARKRLARKMEDRR